MKRVVVVFPFMPRPVNGYTSGMKIGVRVCAVLLLLVASSLSQNHAPTAEQCRADQRLWQSQVDDMPEEISKVLFQTLTDRGHEMADCIVVDGSYWESYSHTAVALHIQQSRRLMHFLERHKLLKQFVAEDAAGKR
jgi:hypothetical protein